MLRDMGITEQCEVVHDRMLGKGFWDHAFILIGSDGEPRYAPDRRVDNPSIFEEKLMLMVSEVAEVLEARRDKDEQLEEEECADVLIRLMDYCGARGFDLGAAYMAKMRKNADRPRLHGRAR